MGIAKDVLEGSATQLDLSGEGGTIYFTNYLPSDVNLMTVSVTVRNVEKIFVEVSDNQYAEIATIKVSYSPINLCDLDNKQFDVLLT